MSMPDNPINHHGTCMTNVAHALIKGGGYG